MAKQSLNIIKNWFRTGYKPTQQQFWDTWDSFWHKDEKIPIANIEDLNDRFDEKADAEALTNHLNNESAHSALFSKKADKVHSHQIGDVVGLSEALARTDPEPVFFADATGSVVIDFTTENRQSLLYPFIEVWRVDGNNAEIVNGVGKVKTMAAGKILNITLEGVFGTGYIIIYKR